MDRIKEYLLSLLEIAGISGREGAVLDRLEALAAPLGACARDRLGNLVVRRPGPGKRILIGAHADTVGLVVTRLEEGGFARFLPVGGLKSWLLPGVRVRFDSGAVALIRAEQGVEPKELRMEKLYLDLAGQQVTVGESAVYCGEAFFAGNKVLSPYLDDRLGCAICLRALELLGETENDVSLVFTVQEEVGSIGAGPAAFALEPELAIAVDVTAVPDFPGKDRPNGLTLEGGPIIKIMDADSIGHPAVIERLQQAGDALGLACQRLVTKRGGTDAALFAPSRSGVPTAVLAIPIRYTHSPDELADLHVAEDCARLLAEAIAR